MPTVGNKFKNVQFDQELFTNYMQEKETISTAILMSGIIVKDPRMDIISEQGYQGTIPVYLPASAETEALNYDGVVDNVPTELRNKVQTFVAKGMEKAWQENSFLRYLIGNKTPLQNLADNLVATYYAIQWKKVLLAITKGVLSATGLEAHTTNAGSIAGVDIYSAVSDIKQKACGDMMGNFALAVMHSKIYNELLKQEVIQFRKYTDPNAIALGEVAHIGDCIVIPDDDCFDTNGSKYQCYLFAKETFLEGDKAVDTPYYLAYDPEKAGGVHKLYTKQAHSYHPNGMSFDTSKMASFSPTLAELSTGTNWSLVTNHKLIGIALLTFTD